MCVRVSTSSGRASKAVFQAILGTDGVPERNLNVPIKQKRGNKPCCFQVGLSLLLLLWEPFFL